MAHVLAHILAILAVSLSVLFLLGIVVPRRFIAVARRLLAGSGIGGPVAIRLLLGALLWFSAPVSLTPAAFRLLACVMLVAAFGTLFLGTDRAVRLIDHMAGWPPPLVRLPSAVGLVFTAFMLWSVSPVIGGF